MKYLSFRLGEETFGVPVQLVQEVLEYTTVTRVPRCPRYILGIVNLRGSIVAVMDLRRRLDIPEEEVSVTTHFVVLNLTLDGQETPVAMMADSVNEVIEIRDHEVDPAPTADTSETAVSLVGVGKLETGMILLLDVSSLLTVELLDESFSRIQ